MLMMMLLSAGAKVEVSLLYSFQTKTVKRILMLKSIERRKKKMKAAEVNKSDAINLKIVSV